ncbi:MAG: YggS family pyridoxal phosphate-dependent enzyme [Acidobacteriaceae bacterium]|nr:YggS family pyridoxal phosphate-dependent enzyme [Acidobacteriaceae bacterium]
MPGPPSIAENLQRVHEQIAGACRRAARSENEVALMAVSKTHSVDRIAEAYAAGQRLFGENRVQEFEAKSGSLIGQPDAIFHLIGPLQSNKTSRAAGLFHSVDTVDSVRIAQRLNDAAAKLNKTLPILIEIKTSAEESKSGIPAESDELDSLLEILGSAQSLEVRGLMTVPPYSDDLEVVRPYFARLRNLRDHLAKRYPRLDLHELSMGMSHDFTVAIEEGSTCVRIGTAIFGARQ